MPLPRIQRGEPITARTMNAIIDEINKSMVVSVVGGKMSRTAGGTTIAVASQPAVGIIPPFTYQSVATSGVGLYFKLTAGTINNYLPDNNFDEVQLSATTPSENDINFVTLDCLTNGQTVVSASISATSVTPPVPTESLGSAPITFSALIHVVKGTIPYRVIGPSSIVARVAETLRIASPTFGIGQFPYNIYYTWALFS